MYSVSSAHCRLYILLYTVVHGFTNTMGPDLLLGRGMNSIIHNNNNSIMNSGDRDKKKGNKNTQIRAK